jgi:hypothetical protein
MESLRESRAWVAVYIAILGNLTYNTEFKIGDGCRERLDAWLAGKP